MDRKIKIGSISAGLALITLPFGGWGAALMVAGAGCFIGDKQFPKGEKPWRDIQELLNEKEHSRLEFKETLSDTNKKKSPYEGLIKTIAAFANSDGGEVLLGISDAGAAVGIEALIRKAQNKDKFEQALRNTIRSNIDGVFKKFCRLKFETVEQKEILRIEVEKSNKHIFTKPKGDFYIRDGNTTRLLSAKEYDDFQTKNF